jgi:hypothetical protein
MYFDGEKIDIDILTDVYVFSPNLYEKSAFWHVVCLYCHVYEWL